ncbi:unnamed protein product, partial [Trichogramma brassicae]
MPNRIYLMKEEKTAPGYKISKESLRKPSKCNYPVFTMGHNILAARKAGKTPGRQISPVQHQARAAHRLVCDRSCTLRRALVCGRT